MYLFIVIGGFILCLVIFAYYWRQMVEQALMRHFRAAEIIAEGYFPPSWVKSIDRQLHRQRWSPLRWIRKPKSGTDLAFAKLDEVATFFLDNSDFIEREAKRLLMQQFKAAHDHWQTLTWEELRQETPPVNESTKSTSLTN